jgi:hypothetical protein
VEAMRVIVPAADWCAFLGKDITATTATVIILAWTPSPEKESPQKTLHLTYTRALDGFIVFEKVRFRKKSLADFREAKIR